MFGIYDAEKMLVVFRGDDVRGCFVGINGNTKAKGEPEIFIKNNCQIYVWERDGRTENCSVFFFFFEVESIYV